MKKVKELFRKIFKKKPAKLSILESVAVDIQDVYGHFNMRIKEHEENYKKEICTLKTMITKFKNNILHSFEVKQRQISSLDLRIDNVISRLNTLEQADAQSDRQYKFECHIMNELEKFKKEFMDKKK